MNMNFSQKLLVLGFTISVLGFVPTVFGFTGLICLTNEANPSCSNFGQNGVIQETKTTSVVAGKNGPLNISADGCQQVTFYVDNARKKLTSWVSTSDPNCADIKAEPINVVIAKTKNPSADEVCFYSDGTIEEQTDILTDGQLNQVSFCTNSPASQTPEPPPPPEQQALQSCDANNFTLNGDTIECNSSSIPTAVMSFRLDESTNAFTPDLCQCNGTLMECDPDAPPTDPTSCLYGAGPLQALVPIFEGIPNGSIVCRTSGGERRCWRK